jgi:putative flippase GtrA
LTGQAVRYLLVGLSNTVITLAGYALLVAAGVPAVAAPALAFAAGALNGYRLNRAWTFRSARRGAGPGARYLVVVTLGLGLNALAVALAVHGVGLPKLAGEVAALPPVTALTFGLARSWVFGGASADPTADRRSPGPAVPRPR